jgi:adenine phosphoribosyltransferase
VRKAGGEVVGIGVILTEAKDWQEVLGDDVKLLHSLAHIPQFDHQDGEWKPIPESFL